ncbi:MAG: hypothetical protein ABI580_05360, partial [Burkholderiaceae bacterium]
VVAAAITFTLASGATNLLYGIAKGTDLPTSIVWGAVAAATSIGLALAPAAVVASLSARRYTAALIALVAVAIFGAYSVTAALGSATGGEASGSAHTLVLGGLALQVLLIAARALIKHKASESEAAAQGLMVLELVADGVTVFLFAWATLGAVIQASSNV